MAEFPADIIKDAEEAVAGFMGWIEGGNTTASLSEHAVDGLKHSFASAILAERERIAEVVRTEAELPGEPPPHVVEAMERAGPVMNARAAVRATKSSILQRMGAA